MKKKTVFKYLYFKPKHFEKLLEMNNEFIYTYNNKDTHIAGFNRAKFEKTERKHLKLNANNKYYRHFICAYKKQFIGYIWFGQSDNNREEGFIGILYVRPKFRQRGIAKELLKEAINWVKEKKCISVDLATHPTNKGAIILYEKMGFIKQKPEEITFKMNLK